jgi:hypothetical protein
MEETKGTGMNARKACGFSLKGSNQSCHSSREQKASNQHLQGLRMNEIAAQCTL